MKTQRDAHSSAEEPNSWRNVTDPAIALPSDQTPEMLSFTTETQMKHKITSVTNYRAFCVGEPTLNKSRNKIIILARGPSPRHHHVQPMRKYYSHQRPTVSASSGATRDICASSKHSSVDVFHNQMNRTTS